MSAPLTLANAERQVTEIAEFVARYGDDALVVTTPALLERLRRCVRTSSNPAGAKKCLALELRCDRITPDDWVGVMLSVSLPTDYPDASPCAVVAARDGGEEAPACTAAVHSYVQSFRGCECLEPLVEWLKDNAADDQRYLRNDDTNDDTTTTACHVLRYNHLLKGPEHKKEKAMLDAARKSRLQGGLLWGTPGIVIAVPPSTEDDAKEYGRECRSLGKTASGPEIIRFPTAGLEEAGLGGLAQQKRGGRPQEMDKTVLRTACGGNEELIREVLGISC